MKRLSELIGIFMEANDKNRFITENFFFIKNIFLTIAVFCELSIFFPFHIPTMVFLNDLPTYMISLLEYCLLDIIFIIV